MYLAAITHPPENILEACSLATLNKEWYDVMTVQAAVLLSFDPSLQKLQHLQL